jgi:hypothetical protein
MPLSKMEKKFAEANALGKMGEYQEEIKILKEIVSEAEEIEDRMFAAGMIASVYGHNILQDDPEPGTQEYNEVHNYLKIALKEYDDASVEAQEAFRSSIPDFKLYQKMLELMDAGKPLSQPSNTTSKKSGCFIATATYGSPNAQEVITLKKYRDEVLLKSYLGFLFVKLYYLASPALAKIIAKSNFLKNTVRFFLIRPIIKLLKH